MNITNIWDKISRWCFYGALVLTPLFFFPLTIYPLALNKQTVLVGLVSLSFVFWLVSSVVKKEIIYNKNWPTLITFGLVVFAAISARFSEARNIAFFGISGGEVDVFINIFAFGLAFFLGISLFRDKNDVKRLINLFLISSGIVLVFSLLQLFGVWLLPWQFAQAAFFNPIGTVNALAIYLGGVFLMSFALLYLGTVDIKKPVSIALIILATLSFLTSFLIDFWPVFVGWIVAMIVLIIVQRNVFLPSVILAISLFLILTQFGVISFNLPTFNSPLEVSLTTTASWGIAKDTIGEGVKSYIFGAGPATYQYKYSFYRANLPKSNFINLSRYWNIRFAQGVNAIFTHLVNWGFVGVLLWLVFIITLGVTVFKKAKVAAKKNKELFWTALLGLAYLILMLFFYPQNFVLYFSIFVLAGLVMGLIAISEKTGYTSLSLAGSSKKSIAWSLVVIFLIMLTIALLYVQGQRYVGAVYFEQAVKSVDKVGDADKALPYLLTALNLDSGNDLYLRTISTTYLLKLKELLSQESADTKVHQKELQTRFTEDLGSAVQAAKRAVEVNGLNSRNWLNLAEVYESSIGLVKGAEEASYAAYKKAVELEPSNPVVYASWGRAYLVAKNYKKAMEKLNKSIALKPNYLPARFLLAVIYKKQGRTREAIAQLELAEQINPDNKTVKDALDDLRGAGSSQENDSEIQAGKNNDIIKK